MPWFVLAAYDFIIPHFFWDALVGSWFLRVMVLGFRCAGFSPKRRVWTSTNWMFESFKVSSSEARGVVFFFWDSALNEFSDVFCHFFESASVEVRERLSCSGRPWERVSWSWRVCWGRELERLFWAAACFDGDCFF